MSRTIAKIATALLLAGAVGSATVAEAHTLSGSQAKSAAKSFGDRLTSKTSNDYIYAEVINCRKLFPHIYRCSVGYDTAETRGTDEWACVDRLEPHYRAHSENRPGVFVKYAPGVHPC